jgi:sugar lactone lactonase YvrE
MFAFPLRIQRMNSGHAHRCVHRLRVEALEDRAVPSIIPDGWLIETTSPSGFAPRDQWSTLASFPTGVFAVDPSTGTQALVAARSGGLLSLPRTIAVVNDKLYVADNRVFGPGGGGILQVDPVSGDQSLVALPGDLHHIHGPTAVTFVNGSLYVASSGNDAGTVLPNLVQVNLSTLAQTEISYGGNFSHPVGLASVLNDDEDIYWADATGGISGTGQILEVNLSTGVQKLVTQGDLLNFPAGMAQAFDPDSGLPTGNLLVVNGGNGTVVRIRPDGAQSQVASLNPASSLDSLAVGPGIYGPGTILIGASAKGTTPGKIFAVDPRTGDQTILSLGGDLSRVGGLAFSSDGNTLYVGTSPSTSSTPIDISAKTGILGVNPTTGVQTLVSARPPGLFGLPLEICEGSAPEDYLYVADVTAFDTGAIIRIDPSDGSQTLLATGGYIYGPDSITFVNGYVYVANTGDSSSYTHNVIRIDPNNLDINTNQTLITDGSGLADFFTNATGIAPVFGDPDSIYLADEPGNVGGTLPGQIWKINLLTGEQSRFGPMFPTSGFEAHVDRIAVDPTTGNLYAETIGGDGAAGSLVLVGPDSFTEISAHDKFIGNNGIAVKPDGTAIYIPTISSAGVANARILVIDLTDPTGTQSIVTEGSSLSLVGGLRVFQESGGVGSPPPGPGAAAPLVGRPPANDADLGRSGKDFLPLLGTVLPEAHRPQLLSQPLLVPENGKAAGSTLQRASTHQALVPTVAVDFFFADWTRHSAWAAPILVSGADRG